MNQMLTPAEVKAIATPIPLRPPAMTKRKKLEHFARVIRGAMSLKDRFGMLIGHIPGNSFVIFHNLEYCNDRQLAACYHPYSALQLAGDDPALQKAGLRKDIDGQYTSALETKRFFELSQEELHEFSCDCGGVISNVDMANRIERIAARS